MNIAVRQHSIDETSQWAFFVGAPRCGTTSLSKYLRSHPSACVSRPKEPHFFTRRDLGDHSLDDLRQVIGRDYLDRFFAHRHPHSILAEGSVSYLYAPQRLEPVLRLWPRAKFIICVRNPLQMLPSLHQRNFINGDETEKKFERAWALVGERRNGRRIPRSCLDPRLLDYREAGYLGRHVERFLSAIGRERCLITVFDDLTADTKSEYGRVLQFLDLPDDGKSTFERNAETRGCRIHWLQRLLQRPPKLAMNLVDVDDLHSPRFKESAGPLVKGLLDARKAILNWNKVPAPRPTIDRAVIDEMRALYRDDVALLSKLTERDLSHWLQPGQVSTPATNPQRSKLLAFQGRRSFGTT